MKKVIFSSVENNNEIKDMNLVDMHCHTNLSDGRDSAEVMITRAKRLGIGISITDHNEVNASLKACRVLPLAIPGIEVTSSDSKDLLVYFYKAKDLEHFYNKYIKGNNVPNKFFNLRKLKWSTEELLDFSKEYNTLISLPHPFTIRPKNSYVYMKTRPKLLKKIDAIEIINSAMTCKNNKLAYEWAEKLKLPFTAASDAHMSNYLGKAVVASHSDNLNDFLDSILKKKTIVVGNNLRGFSAIKHNINIIKNNLTW